MEPWPSCHNRQLQAEMIRLAIVHSRNRVACGYLRTTGGVMAGKETTDEETPVETDDTPIDPDVLLILQHLLSLAQSQ